MLSRLDACEDGKIVRRCRTQASNYSSQSVVDGRVNEAGVSTAATKRASHLKRTTCDVNFLRSDSRCRRYVSVLSNVTPRYVGPKQEGRVSLLWSTLSSCLASLLLRYKAANTAFVVISFNFPFWRYSPKVAMSLLSTPSTFCQSSSACMNARSLAYAYFMETVVGKAEV